MRAILIILFLSAGLLQAQNTPAPPPIKSEQVDIVKSFEPELIRSTKIAQQPNLPKLTTDSVGAQRYNVTDRLVKVDYKAGEIRPMAASAAKEELDLPIVRLKAGFGMYLTPLVDLMIANRNQEKFSTGLNFDFISSKNNSIENQRMMDMNAGANFTYYFKNFYLGADAAFNMHRAHFYGYDDEDTSFTEEETEHTYRNVQGGLNFGNIGDNKLTLDYKGHIIFGGISDSYDQRETNVEFSFDAVKTFREIFGVGARIDAEYAGLNDAVDERTGFMIGLTPYARIEKGIWRFSAGPSIWFRNGKPFIYADIHNQLSIYKDHVVLYNDWFGQTKLTTLKDISRENPFLSQFINWQDYRKDTRNFVGLRGVLPFGLDYDLLFAQQVYRNKPLFINDPTDYRKFVLVYEDKLSAFNPHVSLGFRYADMFRSAVTMDYYIYNTSSQPEAWHMPTLQLGWHNTFNWEGKLTIGGTVLVNAGAKALTETGSVVTLDPAVDLTLDVAYQLNKYIGFFGQVNNTLIAKYKQYYNYPSYSFLVLGGVIVSY